jgi:fumarate reductase iron-sulfur subunit
MKERLVQLEVLRYNPDTDTEAHFQRYEVVCQEEWVVLDALNKVKAEHRPDAQLPLVLPHGRLRQLRHDDQRRAQAVLPCLPAQLRRRDPGRAAGAFPDRARPRHRARRFHGKAQAGQALCDSKQKKPIEEGEYKQTPAQLMKFRQYSMCINCMLCYAACPEYGLTPQFIGPAALTLAHRYNLDSRDGGRKERQEVVATKEGVWECTFVGACSEVCPAHVDPASACSN